jgi:hypothetical protein
MKLVWTGKEIDQSYIEYTSAITIGAVTLFLYPTLLTDYLNLKNHFLITFLIRFICFLIVCACIYAYIKIDSSYKPLSLGFVVVFSLILGAVKYFAPDLFREFDRGDHLSSKKPTPPPSEF